MKTGFIVIDVRDFAKMVPFVWDEVLSYSWEENAEYHRRENAPCMGIIAGDVHDLCSDNAICWLNWKYSFLARISSSDSVWTTFSSSFSFSISMSFSFSDSFAFEFLKSLSRVSNSDASDDPVVKGAISTSFNLWVLFCSLIVSTVFCACCIASHNLSTVSSAFWSSSASVVAATDSLVFCVPLAFLSSYNASLFTSLFPCEFPAKSLQNPSTPSISASSRPPYEDLSWASCFAFSPAANPLETFLYDWLYCSSSLNNFLFAKPLSLLSHSLSECWRLPASVFVSQWQKLGNARKRMRMHWLRRRGVVQAFMWHALPYTRFMLCDPIVIDV